MGTLSLQGGIWIFGADSGGTSLLNLQPTQVDLTDGSWTLNDPDSLVKSVSFSSGYNTVTWNALGAGSNNYVWSAGADIRAPRWYKNFEIDSTVVTADDHMILMSTGKLDLTSEDFNGQVVYGICTDPTATTANTVDASGGILYNNGSGQQGGGLLTENTLQGLINSNHDRLLATVSRGCGNMNGVVAINIKSDGSRQSSYAKVQNEGLSSGANQRLFVGVGTNGSQTVSEDDTQKFSIRMLGISQNKAL